MKTNEKNVTEKINPFPIYDQEEVIRDFLEKLFEIPNSYVDIRMAKKGTSDFNSTRILAALSVTEYKARFLDDENSSYAFNNGVFKTQATDLLSTVPSFKPGYRTETRHYGVRNRVTVDVDFKDYSPYYYGKTLLEQYEYAVNFYSTYREAILALEPWLVCFSGHGLQIHFHLATHFIPESGKQYREGYLEFLDVVKQKTGISDFDRSCAEIGRGFRLPYSVNAKIESMPVRSEVWHFNRNADASAWILPIFEGAKLPDKIPSSKRSGDQDQHKENVKAALTFRKILEVYGYKKFPSWKQDEKGMFLGSSPWNEDRNPSCHFHEDERWFKDFSSGNGGDIFKFLALMAGIDCEKDFPQVLKRAEEITGISRPASSGGSRAKNNSSASDKSAIDFLKIANEFRHCHSKKFPNFPQIRHHQGIFYVWSNDSYYQTYSEKNLEYGLLRWMQSKPKYAALTSRGNVQNVLYNLVGGSMLPPEARLPLEFPKDGVISGEKWIPVKNGRIIIERLKTGGHFFADASPYFLSGNLIPWEFDATKKCPKWKKFLEEVLPDPGARTLIQQWIGYLLYPDTSQQAFMLLYGNGGDGKSVLCAVIKFLLGSHNISSVPLEAFSPTRTFNLAETAGKLANIVEELNITDRYAEGELKKFVSGNRMQVERKNADPFEFDPTARSMFCTNELPPFHDRSNGLWRRLMIVHFPISLPIEKQNKELLNLPYWKDEFPGILNWALEGLRDLLRKGNFDEPQSSKDLKGNHREDCNPIGSWIRDNVIWDGTSTVPCSEVYTTYVEDMTEKKITHYGQQKFYAELRRMHKGLQQTPNALRPKSPHGKRERHFIGIRIYDYNSEENHILSMLRGGKDDALDGDGEIIADL